MLTALSNLAYLYHLGTNFIGGNGALVDLASIWSMGFGSANPASTVHWLGLPNSGIPGLVWNAVIADTPQLILSMIYFSFNAILTTYLAWNGNPTCTSAKAYASPTHQKVRSEAHISYNYRIALPYPL